MRRPRLPNRLTRLPRRTWIILAAVVGASAVAAVLLVWPRPDVDEKVAAAFAAPDPAPSGPIVTSIPPDCGVTEHTMDDLAPAGEYREDHSTPDAQSCYWSTRDYYVDARPRRELQVDVDKEDETSNGGASRLGAAVDEFVQRLDDWTAPAPDTKHAKVRRLSGLGDDAVT